MAPITRSTSLKALQTRLKSLQEMFNDICDFVTTLEEETIATRVTVRLEKLEDLWEKVNEAIIDIEMHDDYIESDETYSKQRSDFGNRYYEAKSLFLEKVKELEGGPSMNVTSQGLDVTQQSTIEHVRLPQIKLQTFDGNIDEWLSFRDLYLSLIHHKADLPDVEKFHYLKGCLAGEAKALVDPLALTRGNYQVAWDTLMKRYNDSKQLKRRQIQALFRMPTLVKESGADLQALVESFERAIHTLDQLVDPTEYKDLLLLDILGSRLDPITRRGWEEYSASKEKDTIKDMVEFLQRRIRMLGSLPFRGTGTRVETAHTPKRKQPLTRTTYNAVQSTEFRCIACSDMHLLYQCPKFRRMTVSARDKLLRSHSLCRNCFKRGHQAADCSSRFVCRICKAKHHTLVCFRSENFKDSRETGEKRTVSPMNEESSQTSSCKEAIINPSASTSNTASFSASTVLLATAVILVEDEHGTAFPARALLDSGSECNFMTEGLCQRLRFRRRQADIAVSGIGQENTRVKHAVSAIVRSRFGKFSCKMDFLLLPRVTADLPTKNVVLVDWNIPNGIELADPAFTKSKSVDIILGIQHFFSFFKSGNEISLAPELPSLTESVFGWVVTGTVGKQNTNPRINCNSATSSNLEEMLTRFWICEEIETPTNYSPDEQRCEEAYKQTVKRGLNGRYTVSLPKYEDVLSRMGESRDIAFRRLQGLERRLLKDPNMRQEYNKFMEEYLLLGHMRKVDRAKVDEVKRYFLPHHPVIKSSSTTTKLRVVFDASCKTGTGISLNDALMVGPVIQDDLRAIILRCRIRQIMLVADVEKMFRQINMNAEDIPLQSILWRTDTSEDVGVYELTTVTYGTKPAPFLATRTLKQLAEDEKDNFPLAANTLTEDVYMDDVITGVDNVKLGIELRYQLDSLLQEGGFKLRKWASNCPRILEGVPPENLALSTTNEIQLDPDPTVKTLGLTWIPRTDKIKFQFEIPPVDTPEELTRRKVLSIIATLFDPLGLFGAVITTGKLFMQRLWRLNGDNGKKLDWDNPLPLDVMKEWKEFQNQLPILNEILIDRCVILRQAESIELHLFSDASEKAYGACAYLRSCDSSGAVRVILLASKSKVAPLKCQSLPRLELCGALMAAQLAEQITKSIKLNTDVYFWTDSTCVLQWLKAIPTTWVTFVANRVAKVQAITEGRVWRHVPGVDNPADLISRGVTPIQLRNNSFWWEGPAWLKKAQDIWPSQSIISQNGEAETEVRHTTTHNVVQQEERFSTWYIKLFPNFTRLLRSTAYWLRLLAILQHTLDDKQKNAPLTARELKAAETILIRHVQREEFEDEWKALHNNKAVSRRSALRWYNPRFSAEKLICVGGRLEHSSENQETKHPVVLPSKHVLTRMIMEHFHKQLLHAGPQLLLATIRLKYWPLGGRNVARSVVHKCQRCFRVKPTAVQQFMGELPPARVNVARPFSKSGVDYFGPVYVRPGPRRTAVKAYVCLFVCLCTKAVHLELVTDLSTNRFLQALRRFFARRGRSSDIFSDNGTNFIGARNQLQELFKLLKSSDHHEQVTRECAKEGIQWHFNPPSAPHFGGLWEAAVRSAKFHLLRILGNSVISFEDMNTLLVQVEACLNSRPITAMSDDPNDLEPLTPGHFLVGTSLQQIPDPDYSMIPMNRLNHWQAIQRKLHDFWTRWRTEYLAQLQGRSKRWQPPVPINVGQLAVIREENLPPIRWKMGRIDQVHPGADGIIRVVTLKTAAGFLKRPVEKICILPFIK